MVTSIEASAAIAALMDHERAKGTSYKAVVMAILLEAAYQSDLFHEYEMLEFSFSEKLEQGVYEYAESELGRALVPVVAKNLLDASPEDRLYFLNTLLNI